MSSVPGTNNTNLSAPEYPRNQRIFSLIPYYIRWSDRLAVAPKIDAKIVGSVVVTHPRNFIFGQKVVIGDLKQ